MIKILLFSNISNLIQNIFKWNACIILLLLFYSGKTIKLSKNKLLNKYIWVNILNRKKSKNKLQDYNKLIEEYERALKLFNKKKLKSALSVLNKIIKQEKYFIDAKLLIAKIKQKKGDLKRCRIILNSIVKYIYSIKKKYSFPKYNPEFNKGYVTYIYNICLLYYRCGAYKKSLKLLKTLKKEKILSTNIEDKISILAENLEFSIKNLQYLIKFKTKLLPAPLNTFSAQYFPILSIDQKTIFFTCRMGYSLKASESICMSEKDENGKWSIPTLVSRNINTSNNEGACTLSSDGNIIIFSAYRKKRSKINKKQNTDTDTYPTNSEEFNYGSCDLYVSYKEQGRWSKPKNLGPIINSTSWQSQPSLSADGKTLYFSSRRPGNIGKKDIWKSTLIDGRWSHPVNLGPLVNSTGNEISPFIHPNGTTLFFASDRVPSLGGLDIYYSKFINGRWSVPKNLGFPINNHNDQVSLFISADGKTGCYAAGTQKGIHYNGKLYEFKIPEHLIPKPSCAFFKGKLKPIKDIEYNTDKSQNNDYLPEDFINHAKIYVYDIKKNKVDFTINITKNGDFCIPLNSNHTYMIYISKPGFKVKDYEISVKDAKIRTINFSLDNKSDKSKNTSNANNIYSIELHKVENDLILHNFYFQYDTYHITDHIKKKAMSLFVFLKENSKVKINIEGYTDDLGSKLYNFNLSKKRAKAIFDFLISKGISKDRMSFIGLGIIDSKDYNPKHTSPKNISNLSKNTIKKNNLHYKLSRGKDIARIRKLNRKVTVRVNSIY